MVIVQAGWSGVVREGGQWGVSVSGCEDLAQEVVQSGGTQLWEGEAAPVPDQEAEEGRFGEGQDGVEAGPGEAALAEDGQGERRRRSVGLEEPGQARAEGRPGPEELVQGGGPRGHVELQGREGEPLAGRPALRLAGSSLASLRLGGRGWGGEGLAPVVLQLGAEGVGEAGGLSARSLVRGRRRPRVSGPGERGHASGRLGQLEQ